jgi:hypothetical protein
VAESGERTGTNGDLGSAEARTGAWRTHGPCRPRQRTR